MSDLKLGFPAISMIDDGDAAAAAAAVATPQAGGPTTATRDAGGRHSRVAIIGSGPAGLTAAIYAARANLAPDRHRRLRARRPADDHQRGGELPGLPGGHPGAGADGQAAGAGGAVRQPRSWTWTWSASTSPPDRSTCGRTAEEYTADSVIVATGASALWLGLDNETRLRGRGVSACATCDGFFFRGRSVAVVGGGDTALEEATFLTRFATEVTLIHRRDQFRGSKIMVQRALDNPKVRTLPEHGGRGRPGRPGRERPAPAGHRDRRGVGRARWTACSWPSATSPTRTCSGTGCRWTRRATSWCSDETGSNVEGVFIAGDVHDHRYRQAITAAADGCKAAIDAERWLEAQGVAEADHGERLVTAAGGRPRRRRPEGPRLRIARRLGLTPTTQEVVERWLDEAVPQAAARRRSMRAAAG